MNSPDILSTPFPSTTPERRSNSSRVHTQGQGANKQANKNSAARQKRGNQIKRPPQPPPSPSSRAPQQAPKTNLNSKAMYYYRVSIHPLHRIPFCESLPPTRRGSSTHPKPQKQTWEILDSVLRGLSSSRRTPHANERQKFGRVSVRRRNDAPSVPKGIRGQWSHD